MRSGTLIVLSGPSGSGKGTLLKRYTERNRDAFISVSATTREPREGEMEGMSYYFLTADEFRRKIEEGGFLEYAIFCGNYYGTPRDEVEKRLRAGTDVILEIDVQGALQVKENCPEAVMVFVSPPSYESLRKRLVGRGTESAEVINERLAMAKEELSKALRYDYIVINDELERAAEELYAILKAEKCRMANNKEFIERVLENVIS